MRLVELRTIRLSDWPSLGWVELVTDEGIVGLGETTLHLDAVEGYLHEVAAPRILGDDPRDIERHSRKLYDNFTGFGGTTAETKGNSAVDVALWDILGQSLGVPLYRLLGGRCRPSIRTYNTCAGPRYGQVRASMAVSGWNLPTDAAGRDAYEDLDAFLHRPEELAHSLLDDGLDAMKIWTFDVPALEHGGLDITREELKAGLEPIERIRSAVGDRIDIMVELHALWRPGPAKKIARAVEPYEPYWVEDAVKCDDMDAVASFCASTHLPCTFGETIGTRWDYHELLRRADLGYLMLDVCWCGGLSEAKKVAALAELKGVPIAPHDCTGPVNLTAGTHLAVSTPNAVLQESVRAFYKGWYRDCVTDLPTVTGNQIAPPEGPGLGIALQPDLKERPGTSVRTTRLEDL
jgi:galactonate dehydratase